MSYDTLPVGETKSILCRCITRDLVSGSVCLFSQTISLILASIFTATLIYSELPGQQTKVQPRSFLAFTMDEMEGQVSCITSYSLPFPSLPFPSLPFPSLSLSLSLSYLILFYLTLLSCPCPCLPPWPLPGS